MAGGILKLTGIAVLAYLALAYATGLGTILQAGGSSYVGVVKALQGR